MKRTILLVSVLATALACGSGQQTEEPEKVQMKETAVKEIEPPPEPPTEPQEAPAEPAPEPEELAVQMFEVAPDRPAETDEGMQIRMDSGAPDWAFSFVYQGETKTVSYGGEPLYVEGVAFGKLFVISRLGENVQVTLRSDAPAQPLSVEAATKIARDEQQSRLGCEGKGRASAEPNGTLILEVPGAEGELKCRIVVGRYTGEAVDI
jgi:hypothetical protein